VDIDGITHDELLTLTSQIHHRSKAALEGLLLEAELAREMCSEGPGSKMWKIGQPFRKIKRLMVNMRVHIIMEETGVNQESLLSILNIESWIHAPLHSDWNERKQVEPDYNQDG